MKRFERLARAMHADTDVVVRNSQLPADVARRESVQVSHHETGGIAGLDPRECGAHEAADLLPLEILVRRIVNTPPMRDYVVDEFLPGPQVRTDEDWLAFCREAGDTVFHPTSTCSIGAVVDEQLRVKGVSGLRVIDASVMPAVPSGNINAAVIALAEKGADLVKGLRAPTQ